MFALVLGFAVTVPAQALNFGGHDETSEVNFPLWAQGVPSPGVTPAITAIHVLITEFAVTPTGQEFIEIYNPTAEPVDLSEYYLSDNWYEPSGLPVQGYFRFPEAGYQITTSSDYTVQFPQGTTIMPGAAMVIAPDGAVLDATYGAGTTDFEITGTDPTIPDMINVGNNNPPIPPGGALLSNSAEFIMIFSWDGMSDNVCDVDYVTWGAAATTSRVDKTPFAIDGPDADAIATPYKSDTPDAMQSAVPAPIAAASTARLAGSEGFESPGGNGCCFEPPTTVEYGTWGRIKALYR